VATFTGTSSSDTITTYAVSPGVTAVPAGSMPSPAPDTIDGLGGDDNLDGGGGGDTIRGGTGNDRVGVDVDIEPLDYNHKFSGTSSFYGGAGNDRLFSYFTGQGGGVDLTEATFRYYGEAGNDTLSSTYYFHGAQDDQYGAATDTLHGGTGDDTYFLSESADTVIERPGEGYDTVYGY
jgi:Ca2+-binding RTX toxin-like protein